MQHHKKSAISHLLGTIATTLALVFAGNCVADEFPSKPIKLILPLGAGGATENLARLASTPASEALHQPVVIENRPGAGGSIASNVVAHAPADGYTLLLANFATHAVAPTLYKGKLGYDPIADFIPVSLLASQPHVLLVTPELHINTLDELIAYAKANPGKLNFASSGVGSPLHLAGEFFKSTTGINIVHVPYKSSAPALLDLISGRVHIMFDNLSTGLPYVESGKLKAIAVTSSARSPLAPNIPTAKELGLANFETYGWWGILAPKGTPAAVVNQLNTSYAKGILSPEIKDKLTAQGYTVIGSSSTEFKSHIEREIAKWRPVIQTTNLLEN